MNRTCLWLRAEDYPPMPSEDAAKLANFFAAMQGETNSFTGELSQFFRKFDDDFRESRRARAVETPHFDLLRVFRLDFAELRHSAVLAWFLDPAAEHEQGSVFGEALLEWCGADPSVNESYTVVRERHERTDIAAYAGGDFAIFIENKVRHFERDKQVADMVEAMTAVSVPLGIPLERRFAIFLTDSGAEPVSGPTGDTAGFLQANLRSGKRAEIFEWFRASLLRQPKHSPLLLNFLDSYLRAIRRLRLSI